MAGNWTRVDCLEGNHANHYTTIAAVDKGNTTYNYFFKTLLKP